MILFFILPLAIIAQPETDATDISLDRARELMAKDSLDKAKLILKRVMVISLAEEDEGTSLVCLDELLVIADRQNDTEGKLKYKLQALNIHQSLGNTEEINSIHLFLAEFYEVQEIFNKSLIYRRIIFHNQKENSEEWSKATERLAVCHALNESLDSTRYYRQLLVDYCNDKKQPKAGMYHRQKIADAWQEEENYYEAERMHATIAKIALGIKDEAAEATAYNNTGIIKTKTGDYSAALDFFSKANEICGERDILNRAILYTNIGISYYNLNNNDKALEWLIKAAEIKQSNEAQNAINHTISEIYLRTGDIYNAQGYNQQVYLNTNDEKLKSKSLKTAADIEEKLFNFEGAFDFYKQHLEIEQNFRLIENLERQKLLELQTKLERSEKEFRLELAERESEEILLKAEQDRLLAERKQLELENEAERQKREREREEERLENEKRQAELLASEAELKAANLESEAQQQQLALATQKLETERRARELEEAQRAQEMQRLELKAAQDSERLKQQELEASQKEQESQALVLDQQRKISDLNRRIAIIGGIVAALIIGSVFWFLMVSRRKNKQLSRQNDEIENQRLQLQKNRDLIASEQEKSENLLLNILPAPIAAELKEKGYATPKTYQNVTVMFTDFAGFTRVSLAMDADELINELNTCFKAFDEIIERYGIQPIKTIGDSYMCAGGVPLEGSVSPSNMVAAALEIMEYMMKRQALKQEEGKDYWRTRIGIHTGAVVAGVVGKKKFAYDIWGDAVNTASRMESAAELDTVNISQTTFEKINSDYDCTFRGEFEIKNRGTMKMYRVNGIF